MASAAAVETHSDEGEQQEEDEEYEYEEIEVEEEIIEEIEVEVDEDEDDDDFGEPVTPINEENHQNDNSPSKEPRRNEEITKPVSTVPIELIGKAPDDSVLEGYKGNPKSSASSETSRQAISSGETSSSKRDEDVMKSGSTVPGEFITPDDSLLEGCKGNPKISASSETSKQDISSGNGMLEDNCGRASVGDRGVKNANNVKLSGGKIVSAGEADGSNENANGVQYFEEERDRIVSENAAGTRKRLDPVQICQKMGSPELIDGNKRAAIICDFFAKGWCIKGKLCRFLHISDKVADTSQIKVGAPDAANQKREPPVDEASSVAQNAVWDDGGRKKWKCEAGDSSSPKDDPGSISLPNHFERESLRGRSYLDYAGHYASQLVKDNSPAYSNGSFRQAFSNSPLISSDNRKRIEISSSAATASSGEVTNNRTQVSLGDDGFLVSSHCLKRLPVSFSFTSRNADPTHMQNHLVSDPEFQVSLSSSSQSLFSPFPGSQSGYHSRTNFSGDAQRPAEYTTSKSYGDWEPSIPFRPSYLITQRLLAKGNLYDPIRDSVEQTNSGDGFSQFSLRGRSASKDGTKLREKANKELVGTLNSEDCTSRNFLSSRNFHNGEAGKSFLQRDPSTAQSEIVDTAVAEQQGKNSLPIEEKSSNSSHVQDTGGADKTDVDSESGAQRDKHKHKREPKIDRSCQNKDTDANLKTDGHTQDSKAFKHFHAALVEHVKELIRPTWDQGLLSRDAHKLIVKKAVDKVIRTLQPHQVPNTPESVEQYLVVSQTKLAKLVEAYVVKYGKP